MLIEKINDIYDFIPSVDVRELCRKTKHKFTNEEIYKLITDCNNIPMAHKDKYIKKYVTNIVEFHVDKIWCPTPFTLGDIISTTDVNYGMVLSPSKSKFKASSCLFFSKALDGNITLKEEPIIRVEFYSGNKTPTFKKDIQEFKICVDEILKEPSNYYYN